jgi:transcriptional regulator with XRE-family HTH domain
MSSRGLIGQNIRRLRTDKNWTQEKLAVRSNLSPDYVNKLEMGRVNISLDSMDRLARALKLHVSELLRMQ